MKQPLANEIGYVNTLLAYYLHIPRPETLSDAQWGEKYAQLMHILQP